MSKHKSIHHTITPQGYIKPYEGITKVQMIWFEPFVKWLQYIATNQCQK